MPDKRQVLGDFYYREAKREGYRSRSALKLKEIAGQFHVIRKGDYVADLGAAPGGWLQVELELVGEGGIVVGVDLSGIRPLQAKNVRLIRGDITDPSTIEEMLRMVGAGKKFDVIVSDLAPKFSGVHDLDHSRQIALAEIALDAAPKLLRAGGNMVIKVLMGAEFGAYLDRVRGTFSHVKVFKPRASRERSTETYLICKGLRPGRSQVFRPSARSSGKPF